MVAALASFGAVWVPWFWLLVLRICLGATIHRCGGAGDRGYCQAHGNQRAGSSTLHGAHTIGAAFCPLSAG
jgi:hypothetical protein